MKNVVRMLLLSAVVLAGLAVSAAAQSAVPQKAQVGFDFYVGDKLMPAGEYTIRPVSQDISHGVVMIEQVNGNAKAAVQTFPARNAENLKPGSLLFKKYGDNHYLSAFQLDNENYMHQILKNTESRIVKREAARKIAQTGEAKASAPSNE
ncbi:MAG: hypothetical protein JST85_22020 [Acidobacteria bacterium]|nr:hypothetical protein [Acidobacteriota bacterium]